MNWWLEYASIGEGRYFTGTFVAAMQTAFDMCISDSTVVNVYNGENVKVAEQTLNGARFGTFPRRLDSTSPRTAA